VYEIRLLIIHIVSVIIVIGGSYTRDLTCAVTQQNAVIDVCDICCYLFND